MAEVKIQAPESTKKIRGKNVLIRVNKGTLDAPDFVAVAGQTGASLGRTRDTLDGTDKNSEFKKYLTGQLDWSIDCDGLVELGDEGYRELDKAFQNATELLVEFGLDENLKYVGFAIITDFPLDAPLDDLVSYTITLQGSGDLVTVTGEDTLVVVDTDGNPVQPVVPGP